MCLYDYILTIGLSDGILSVICCSIVVDVTVYDTDYVTVFGTPEEVENFNAWCTILKGIQVKNEEDLLKCYRYWRSYHEKS